MQKVLAILSVGILLFGCQGPKVQKGVDGLKADADSLSAQIIAAKPLLTTAADLEKEAAKKLTKEAKDELLTKIDDTQKSLVNISALKAKIGVIKDSLVVLEGKATGKTVDDISALREKLDKILTDIEKFDATSSTLAGIKSKLGERKPTPKTAAPPKPKPEKKIPPPKKK